MDTKLLKHKILDLAIHGKLVPQNPNDESATVLLEKIRAEKAEKIKKGELKADKKDSYIFVGDDNRHYEKFADGTVKDIEDEIPFEVPEGWAWCRLGVLSETTDYIANGSFADTKANVKFYKDKNYALLVKTQDFNNNFTEDLTYTDEMGYNFLSKSHLFGGELLLSNIGASIGKALIVPKFDIPMAVAPNSIVVRTTNLLETHFLKSIMLSTYGQTALVTFTAGSAMPKFNKTQLRSLLIPLPSISVQKSIISIIDNIFEIIQSIDNNKDELEICIKHAKSKILDLAIHGKLVPQDSSDEPASVLLEKLRTEKEAKIKAGELKRDKNDSYIYKSTTDNCYYEKFNGKEPVCIDEEIPFDIPDNWQWVKLNELADIARGGSPRPIEAFITDSSDGINWIKIGDTSPESKYIVSAKEKIIPEGKKHSRYVHSGDFILTNSMSFGRPYILKIDGCIHDGWLVFGDIKETILQDYLYSALSSDYVYNAFSLVAAGSTVKNLKSETVKATLFPLPPIPEQKRIVSKIEEMFERLDQIQCNLI